jgi:hypothetical protein
MSSIAFEYLLWALETTRGTAVDPPTHYINAVGSITPQRDRYRPEESSGVLAEYMRSKGIREWSEYEFEGGLDVFTLPLILSSALKGSVTPTTPSGATNARLWTFNPTMTADDLKSATGYWGDPGGIVLKSAYNMPDSITISADASGTDGATMSVSGQGAFPVKDAPNSLPSRLTAPLITPINMELWLDTGSDAIGTTAITGRFISGEFSFDTGITRKWLAKGTTTDLSFSRIGRGKRHGELTLVFEFLDADQYDLYADANGDTVVKARWRLNGPLIEDDLYHYVEVDAYGPLDSLGWGDHEGSNRTLELTIMTEYDTTAANDFSIKVQNNRTSL